MSAYDDAVAYLDAEVHPRCDYDIYSDMRDIVDEMEDESKKLRELAREMYEDAYSECPSYFDKTYLSRLMELGVEVNRECTIAWLESEDE